MDEIKIHCKYDKLVNPKELKDYSKNPNKHGSDQIERLAQIYKYQGIRHPIIYDPDRDCIAAGHGRKLGAIRAGIKEFPVVYQRFESDEQFYAFVTSDNAIALWADLDLGEINLQLPELGPDFDIAMLGIKDFKLDKDFEPGDENDQGKLDELKPMYVECPHCGESFNARENTIEN